MKNIITNILGLIFWVVAVRDAVSNEPSLSFIISMVVVGGILFLFENSKLISLFNKIINYKLKK